MVTRLLLFVVTLFTLRSLAGEQATAVATVTAGFVTGITVTFGGSGYTSEPAVTIKGGGGNGAAAKAILNGDKVASVIVLNAGSGYSSAPTIVVEAPPQESSLSIELVPKITLRGASGTMQRVEWSPTVGAGALWQVFTNITLGSEAVVMVDLATAVSQRFYRVVIPGAMALIPAGSFQMGDSFNEGVSEERPMHTVSVSAFYMDKYEVTRDLWDEVNTWAIAHGYGISTGLGKAANHPVHSVNWYDAVKWCNARSEKEGRVPAYYTDAALTQVYRTESKATYARWDAGFRLPTEAEWEKAARGGATGHRFSWADTDTITHSHANYLSGSQYSYDVSPTRSFHPTFNDGVRPYTSPAGSFAPNGYGLYDMTGNVWEWCGDWFSGYSSGSQTDPRGPASGSRRVNRGGGWSSNAIGCRTAYRHDLDSLPSSKWEHLGFRCVRPLGQ